MHCAPCGYMIRQTSVRCMLQLITLDKIFLKNCVYHNIMMLFHLFEGADFKNGIKNFVMSMILLLFKIL